MASLMSVGSVTITDNKVAFTEDGKNAKPPGGFCVKGNSLSVQGSDGEVYSAVKQ
jgi:hypothetical protein